MTPKEILSVIEDALATLRTINPPRPGSHHCALCDLTQIHPCPVSDAASYLYVAHSLAYGLAHEPTKEGKP